MNTAIGFFAWLKQLFSGGSRRLTRKIERHLETLRIRRLTYEDQRREIKHQIERQETRKSTLAQSLRQLVEQDKQQTYEARSVGQDLDALKETLADLIARSENRRNLENQLRRVVSAGEELKAFLPQQPDIAVELESILADSVRQMQAENTEALGRLLTFLEQKLVEIGKDLVRHETVEEREQMPESLRALIAEKEQRQRAEIEHEELPTDMTRGKEPQPKTQEPSGREEVE